MSGYKFWNEIITTEITEHTEKGKGDFSFLGVIGDLGGRKFIEEGNGKTV